MALRAVTLLGENTVAILADLCRHVSEVTGIEVTPDDRPPPSSDGAPERVAEADLIWGCGYLMCKLIDSGRLDAEIVAAPVLHGEQGPVYHSVLVAADPAIRSLQDACGRTLAINEPASWSGHHALVRHLQANGLDVSLFASTVETGSHRASIEAVAAGTAAVASIDHTVWEHAVRSGQVVGTVRVVDRTQDWPAPPIAVHRGVAPAARRELVEVVERIPDHAVDGLVGTVPAHRRDYDVMVPAAG